MLNDTHLMGRLTNDIKLQDSRNHVPFVFFSLAVKKDFAGDDKDLVDYIPITAWGKTANYLSSYFKKGDIVVVQASIRNKVRNGSRVGNEIEIVADQVWHGGSPGYNKKKIYSKHSDNSEPAAEECTEETEEDEEEDDTPPGHI